MVGLGGGGGGWPGAVGACRCSLWIGLVVCIVGLGIWALSIGRRVTYRSVGGFENQFMLANGNAAFLFRSHPVNPRTLRLVYAYSPDGWHLESSTHWAELRDIDASLSRSIMSAAGCSGPSTSRNGWGLGAALVIAMPLLCLLKLAALTTAVLWHRDRRTVKPGACRVCGYDLRASKTTCPECGTAVSTGRQRHDQAQDRR